LGVKRKSPDHRDSVVRDPSPTCDAAVVQRQLRTFEVIDSHDLPYAAENIDQSDGQFFPGQRVCCRAWDDIHALLKFGCSIEIFLMHLYRIALPPEPSSSHLKMASSRSEKLAVIEGWSSTLTKRVL
jgi:hypothetical protein